MREYLINSLDKVADKGTSGASGLAMAEAYHYLMGMAPYSGSTKVKADYTGNAGVSASSDALYRLAGNRARSAYRRSGSRGPADSVRRTAPKSSRGLSSVGIPVR